MSDSSSSKSLRSRRWFSADDLRSFSHRSRTKQMGYADAEYLGKPVIAILNTWSDLNPCHVHFRTRAEEVKRGVWQAGGFPVELPALSVTETFMKPSPMMYRNLLAMEAEELLRSQPIDGAVLMGGCDKTTPGLLMGAISMDLPFIYLPAGPMLRGNWHGEPLGSGSDMWKFWDERCAGNLSEEAWNEMEEGIARSPGHCMTMGTASTMTALTEALGLSLPGASSIPAVDANHARMAARCGSRIVDMVREDLKPSDILTEQAFENAVTTDLAIGGSTNAIIHLIAIAGRAGLRLDMLQTFDRLARRTPMIADIRPSGRFLMEDFYYAGGLKALLNELRSLLHLDCQTVTGRTLGENIEHAEVHNPEVIRSMDNPVAPEGGTAVLFGNLAPDGAVIKPTAASEHLLHHIGPAVVFHNYDDLAARLNTDDLEVDEHSVLVLQNAGPVGAGMPEWGMLPIPKKLLERGVRDMVRLSDARMSGTSYGTCVLHIAPESFVGGPLAFVQDGDLIELDVPNRKLELLVSEAELVRRRSDWVQPELPYQRGFGALYTRHVTQANEGCDFDFLHHGAPTPDPPIH